MNTLIVVTNPAERACYEEQLSLAGHDVLACEAGQIALEQCQQMYFPLIVLDCGLPDITAEAFCRSIRAMPQDKQSAVLILADADACPQLPSLIDAGADDYLLKPVDPTTFRLRIHLLERQIRHAQAMEILRTAQTYAGNILESSLDMIIAVDLKRHILEFNRAAQETFGYRLEEVLGKHVGMLYVDAEESAQISHTTMLHGRCVREILNKRKNGEVFPCLLAASVLRDLSGNPIGIMGISRDITERKRDEEALKQAKQQLERQNVELMHAARLKDEFLSLLSHELRTPLTVILSQLELLHEGMYGNLNDVQLSTLESIQQSSHRLTALINDMLDFSKLSKGQFELKRVQVNVELLCQFSLQAVYQQATAKELTLSSNIDRQVQHIQADERLLIQVLLNLLRNAVKFTPAGGSVGLEVQGHADQEHVHFIVWDTGIGIAKEDIDRLFQPFVQLDPRLTREYLGAGLGLSMVGQIVNLHGGHITVESTVGQGSRFTVSLPWQAAEQ